MTNTLSASGARIRGDDYQHLVAWLQVLRAVRPGSGIAAVGIEDPDAGNADDVTVYTAAGPAEWFQVKSSVDGREPVNVEWLMAPSRAGGSSIFQRLYRSWVDSGSPGQRPRIVLMSNRPLDAGDPVVSLRDGRDGTVSRRLREALPGSAAGRTRQQMAGHLGISEEDLLSFLASVSFRLGRLEGELREDARNSMYAVGLRYDDQAIELGIGLVRQWVTGGIRRLSVDELLRAVDSLRLPDEAIGASLLIQAIDRDPMPESAVVALDWVDMFEGDEARTRRRVIDATLWNGRFRRELQDAVRALRSDGHRRVLVRGFMRLPTWFAAGVELGRTAGFDVASFRGDTPWASAGNHADFPVKIARDEKVGLAEELAVGIGLSADPSEDVLRYLSDSAPEVGRYVGLIPAKGPSNIAIGSPAEARGWAFQTRDLIREIIREHRPTRIHLFLATSHGAALLLGHLWDRMPMTQLYEDLGALEGYYPSFSIPN